MIEQKSTSALTLSSVPLDFVSLSFAGELYLLSNEGDPVRRNLSFEREFGREIGLLDLMASVVADRNGRALSRFSQSVATMIFLPVGGLP